MPNTSGAVEIGAPPSRPRPGGQHPVGQRPTPPRFEGLSSQEREALEGMAKANGESGVTMQDVEAMFLVVIPRSGVAFALSDIADAAKYSGRVATVEEMRVACDIVTRDIDQAIQAQRTLTAQMQMAAAVQRQAADAEMRAKLGI
jgi:hypothetical protein